MKDITKKQYEEKYIKMKEKARKKHKIIKINSQRLYKSKTLKNVISELDGSNTYDEWINSIIEK